MRESITSGEVIERLVQQAGIRKKIAAELIRAIPEIIEEGLKSDGEVRVKGLGTFRMKWTQPRVGRNPKTGERVEIPAHNRLVFLPETAFKEYVNRDNRLLSYKVIPTAGMIPPQEPVTPEPEMNPQPVAETASSFQHEPETSYQPETETPYHPEPSTQPAEEINYEFPDEPATPAKKRRIHWIVPVALAVIFVLSLVFYFRNFYQKTEVGSQKSEESSQQSAVGSQQSAVGSQQSAVGSQQLAVEGQQSAVGSQQSDSTQNSEPGTRNPEPETRNPEPVTHNPELIISTEGKHLFRLAREVYGNPFLWVLIYRANLDKIPDPDMVISGKEIAVPVLEGKPDKLTRNDSVAVSDGYRLVYEFYLAKGDPRAEDFRRSAERYHSND